MATKKMKRFEEGGPSTEGGYTPGDATEGMKEAYELEAKPVPEVASAVTRRLTDSETKPEAMPRSRGMVKPSEAEPAKKQTRRQAFDEAFAKAMATKDGNKTFTFDGTEYAKEYKSSKPKVAPAMAAADMPSARSMPANDMPRSIPSAAPVVPMAPAAVMASTTPRGVIPGTSAAEAMDMFRKARAARAAAANQVDPSQLRAEAAGRAAQTRGVNGSAMDNFKQMMGMKKGGKVSSASSRGDGIALRGKTRA
jgi:hypothetical protein